MAENNSKEWQKEQIKKHYDLNNEKIFYVKNGKEGVHIAVDGVGADMDDLTNIEECIRMEKGGKNIWIRSKEAGVEISFDSFADMINAIDKTKAKEYSDFEMLMPMSNAFTEFAVKYSDYAKLEEVIVNAIESLRKAGKTDKEIQSDLHISKDDMFMLEDNVRTERALRRAEEERKNKMSDERLGKYTHIIEGKDKSGNDICYLMDMSGNANDDMKYVDLKGDYLFVTEEQFTPDQHRITNIQSISSVTDILNYLKEHSDNPRKTTYYAEYEHPYELYKGEHMIVGGSHNMVILPDLSYNWDENLWGKEINKEMIATLTLKFRDRKNDKLAEEYLNNLGFPYTTSADEQLPGYYEQAKGWIDTKNIKVDKDIYDIICAFANEEKIARIREQSEAMMKEQEDMER